MGGAGGGEIWGAISRTQPTALPTALLTGATLLPTVPRTGPAVLPTGSAAPTTMSAVVLLMLTMMLRGAFPIIFSHIYFLFFRK